MEESTLRWPTDKEREETEEVCSIGTELWNVRTTAATGMFENRRALSRAHTPAKAADPAKFLLRRVKRTVRWGGSLVIPRDSGVAGYNSIHAEYNVVDPT